MRLRILSCAKSSLASSAYYSLMSSEDCMSFATKDLLYLPRMVLSAGRGRMAVCSSPSDRLSTPAASSAPMLSVSRRSGKDSFFLQEFCVRSRIHSICFANFFLNILNTYDIFFDCITQKHQRNRYSYTYHPFHIFTILYLFSTQL